MTINQLWLNIIRMQNDTYHHYCALRTGKRRGSAPAKHGLQYPHGHLFVLVICHLLQLNATLSTHHEHQSWDALGHLWLLKNVRCVQSEYQFRIW